VVLIPVFGAVVDPAAPVQLSAEHDTFQWLPVAKAAETFAWPRERRAIADLAILLAGGDAGPLDGILRILPP
jgi:hypothetical protein